MKRAAEAPLEKQPADAVSSDDSDSDSDTDAVVKGNKFGLPTSANGSRSDGTLIRKAEMYQAYMKHIPIPAAPGSQVPFTSWQGLADSLKALYHQPLHYLTNLQLRQWDRLRQGSSNDITVDVRLDDLIHPVKAEALVWLMEETHRLTASPTILAKLWATNEFYHSKNFMNVAAMSRQKKLAFDALSRHGYRGGPSVLKVPPPKEPEKEPDWSWSTGKDQNTKTKNDDDKDSTAEESYEERERTRAALVQGEKLINVTTKKEREKEKEKEKSFSQKEKRKRDLGQASRGKNYVEEEKRLLRDNGVYSGFD